MLNEQSIYDVERSCFSNSFVKPLYDSFCFSRIPASIKTLLTGDGKKTGLPSSCFSSLDSSYDLVVLFFLDGLGWNVFERYKDHPFFQRFVQQGVVSKTMAQFPSTTAAELTTIHTGLEVGQTGIYEWFQYEPKFNRIMAPLLFSYAGDPVAESLTSSGILPSELFPFKTIYQELHEQNISSYLFQPAGICQSPYSQTLGKGSHPVSCFHLSQGLKGVCEIVEKQTTEKAYVFFYYSEIDSVGHRKGPDSKQLEQTLLHCLDQLEQEFMSRVVFGSKKVALLLTSDHGMAPVHPKKTIYINKELPHFFSLLKVGKLDKPLVPAGSCRDFFLHVKDECVNEAFSALTALLQEKAEVWKVSDLISQGLFGKEPPSLRFLERVGNLVILPVEGESVWWYEKNRFEQHFYGAHGGLTRSEVETPFLFLPL